MKNKASFFLVIWLVHWRNKIGHTFHLVSGFKPESWTRKRSSSEGLLERPEREGGPSRRSIRLAIATVALKPQRSTSAIEKIS